MAANFLKFLVFGSGYRYVVWLDVDRLIIATRAVTNALIVATNNVSRMT